MAFPSSSPNDRLEQRRSKRLLAAAAGILGGAALLLTSETSGPGHDVRPAARFRGLSAESVEDKKAAAGGAAGAEWKTDPLIPDVVYDPIDGVCSSSLPYAKMCDRRPEEIARYQEWIGKHKTRGRSFDKQLPPLVTMPSGSSFAVWSTKDPASTASAWFPNGTDVGSIYGYSRTLLPYKKNLGTYGKLGQEILLSDGSDYAAWYGFLPMNFGHVLHENLPRLACMRLMLPDETKFLLPDHNTFRNLIQFIDPQFGERVVWYRENDVMRVEGGGTLTLFMIQPNTQVQSGVYNHLLIPHLRRWIMERYPPSDVPKDDDRTIVYATRSGSTMRRVVEPHHEQDILALIERKKEQYGLPHEIVLFNGHRQDGTLMSYEEQMSHFRRAKYIVGPHGSALANIVWTDPTPASCSNRVKLLEFIPGSDSAVVQPQPYNGYYWVLGGLPVDWYQVTYAGNSTAGTTYVELPQVERALDDMFGGKSTDEDDARAGAKQIKGGGEGTKVEVS